MSKNANDNIINQGHNTEPSTESPVTASQKVYFPKYRKRLSLPKYGFFLLLPICLFVFIYASLCKVQPGAAKESPKPAQPAISVVAAAVSKEDFNVYISGLGSVTALNTVSVKTRIDGQLMEVLFREGQIVKRGELLARIDPRPFEVQLVQAEGQIARDESLLNNARLDLQRYKALREKDYIPKQQLDTQEALVLQYEGVVKTDRGQIANAKLQLTYCRITAPIGGRVGLRLLDAGNIVHASDAGGLVVITQVQPIAVIFSIAEDDLPQVLEKIKAGKKLSVEAFDREQKKKLATGSLLSIDNQIDPTTGTLKLKAVFPNEGNELFPNQFVNARLLVDVKQGAIVIPAAAVQRGPSGTFTYVVNKGNTVTVRPVSLGETREGMTLVSKGLTPGEFVVVEGAEKLREGAKVEVKTEAAPQKHNR